MPDKFRLESSSDSLKSCASKGRAGPVETGFEEEAFLLAKMGILQAVPHSGTGLVIRQEKVVKD